jgi:hypothetical protein
MLDLFSWIYTGVSRFVVDGCLVQVVFYSSLGIAGIRRRGGGCVSGFDLVLVRREERGRRVDCFGHHDYNQISKHQKNYETAYADKNEKGCRIRNAARGDSDSPMLIPPCRSTWDSPAGECGRGS